MCLVAEIFVTPAQGDRDGAQWPVRPVRNPEAVHVWCQETDALDRHAVERAEAGLSVEERTRCDRFRFARDRRDYVVAHDLLRRSLGAFERRGPGPSFSLSHTRGFVACAIASGMPVGVDAERVDRSIAVDDLAEHCFGPPEVAALRRCPEPARAVLFVELWTLKEAFLKALGPGLTLDLDGASFELGDNGSIEFTPPHGIDERMWHFGVFAPSDSTRVAVAVCSGLHAQPRFVAGLSIPPAGGAPRRSEPLAYQPLAQIRGNSHA